MLIVKVLCKGCEETKDVRFVGGYPVEEYECCGFVEEISLSLPVATGEDAKEKTLYHS